MFITEPEIEQLIEENDDKWCSIDYYLNFENTSYLIAKDAVNGGCVLECEEQVLNDKNDVINFSKGPKMKRKWNYEYRAELAHHFDVSAIANAGDLNNNVVEMDGYRAMRMGRGIDDEKSPGLKD